MSMSMSLSRSCLPTTTTLCKFSRLPPATAMAPSAIRDVDISCVMKLVCQWIAESFHVLSSDSVLASAGGVLEEDFASSRLEPVLNLVVQWNLDLSSLQDSSSVSPRRHTDPLLKKCYQTATTTRREGLNGIDRWFLRPTERRMTSRQRVSPI